MSTDLNVSARAPRIAIVGSGPSGCYMAQSLRKAWRDAEIVIYDRLDEPYGLLRFGVAPDHLGTKGITKQFDRLFSRDRVAFVGGTEIGRDISVEQLRSQYDAVVLATGLWGDRVIEGFHDPEGTTARAGLFGSGELTRVINGFPQQDRTRVRLGRRTTIVGNGNVAIDLIRLLLASPQRLAEIGVPQDVIDALGAGGPLERIDVVGRSRAECAKFDIAMLRELEKVPDVRFASDAAIATAGQVEDDGAKKLDVLADLCEGSSEPPAREVNFYFGWTPDHVVGDDRVEQAIFRCTDGERDELRLEADSVCTAVGFTEVANDVLLRRLFESEHTDLEAGVLGERLYCVGWLRRGPVGTIPTNRTDARTVATRIIADIETTAAAGAAPITERTTPTRETRLKETA